jgi:hypothetical protein
MQWIQLRGGRDELQRQLMLRRLFMQQQQQHVHGRVLTVKREPRLWNQ